MTSTSSRGLEDLSKSELSQLAELLSNPDGRITYEFLEAQELAIASLPSALKRPSNFAGRFLKIFAKDKVVLCDCHRKLNAQLIRHIFSRLTDECTYRLRYFNDNPRTFPSAIEEWRQRMVAFESMWTDRTVWRELNKVQPGEPHYRRVHSNCEACILAVVGGSTQMIMDLYIATSSRRSHKNYGDFQYPPLHRLLEAWLEQEGLLDGIFEASLEITEDVREIRIAEQKKRRARAAERKNPQEVRRRHDDVLVRTQSVRSRPSDDRSRPVTAPQGRPKTSASSQDQRRVHPSETLARSNTTSSRSPANTSSKRTRAPSPPAPPIRSHPTTSVNYYVEEEPQDEQLHFYPNRLSRAFGPRGQDSRTGLHPLYAQRIDYDSNTGNYAPITEEPESPVSPVSSNHENFGYAQQDYVNGFSRPISPFQEEERERETRRNTHRNRYSGSIYNNQTPSPPKPRAPLQPGTGDSGYRTDPFISLPSAQEFEAAHRAEAARTESRERTRPKIDSEVAAARADAYDKLHDALLPPDQQSHQPQP